MPIAVVGMGLRLPDDATCAEGLWEMLIDKKSARRETPPDRFNINAFSHPNADKNGTMNNRGGHFLKEDIAAFDAPFFSISPAEAEAMDPTQRILLEVVYEATENAGIPMSELSGTETGCFVGNFTCDYDQLSKRDVELLPKYHITGTGQSIISNRVSFCFNLKGPSVTLDTACSSGLVATHLACQSLRSGESQVAIVGATNIIMSPDIQVSLTNLHFLSPDSTCYAFDERGNGYARGEGVAALVLKPLEAALRDGDTIRAVIRGTAVNSDGKTPGITVPSTSAQISVIESAYKQAGCDPALTGYFEAHGTGTKAGDPIEAKAIGHAIARHRPGGQGNKLYVGSIKTNLGHMEGASGVAGLIKAILSVEKGIIAPNIWFQKGNPDIDFDGWRIQVPTEPSPWPTAGLRRASINSFGYGGTNSHVIIDDAYHYMLARGITGNHRTALDGYPPKCQGSVYTYLLTARPRVFHLSANDRKSVKEMARAYAKYLSTHQELDENQYLEQLSYTLSERRTLLPWGCSVVARSKDELIRSLETTTNFTKRSNSTPQIGFIFTGQGAQWWAMGRELLQYSVFAASLAISDKAVQCIGADWSMLTELMKPEAESQINRAYLSQPICTAVQIALVDLYASWGIHPSRVVGHSSGEIAAAYATGALSIKGAILVSYVRGLLTENHNKNGKPGSMMAAGLSNAEAVEEIEALGHDFGKVVVACVNSPRSVTISGDKEAISQLERSLKERGIFARTLQIGAAYHSDHVLPYAESYRQSLADLSLRPWNERKPVQMFSSVTKKAISPDSDVTADYWVDNMTSCVEFSDALSLLCTNPTAGDKSHEKSTASPVNILIELGPHSALAGPVKQILSALSGPKPTQIQYLSSLVRNTPADESILQVAAALFAAGYPVDIRTAQSVANRGVEEKQASPVVELPPYKWNHERRYWSESRLSLDYRFRRFPRTDILGAPFHDWNPIEPRWRNFIRVSEQPWVKSHVVQGAVVYPAGGFCCMALEAAFQINDIQKREPIAGYKIRDVSISRALVVPQTDEGVEVVFSMRPSPTSSVGSSDTWSEFRIFSHTPAGGWMEHCRGLVSVFHESQTRVMHTENMRKHELSRFLSTRGLCDRPVESQDLYQSLHAAGLSYGPEFQGMVGMSLGRGSSTGSVRVTDTSSVMPQRFEHDRVLHPATMDTFLQTSIAALCEGDLNNIKSPFMPVAIDEVYVSAAVSSTIGDEFTISSDATLHGFREAYANVIALQGVEHLNTVLKISGIKCINVAASGESSSQVQTSILQHAVTAVWEPDVDHLGNDDLSRYIRLLSHKYPDLKYLEIKAGTGGLAEHVLSALDVPGLDKSPRLQSFTYTDTSAHLLEKAEKRFESSANLMQFKQLNIQEDPDEQGFKSEQFDVVLVANLMYMAQDIDQTLAHIRKLLRRNGKLILVNQPQPLLPPPLVDTVAELEVSLSGAFRNLAYASPDEESANVMIYSLKDIAATAKENDHAPEFSQITIVRPVSETPDANEVVGATIKAMEEHGLPNEVCTFLELTKRDIRGHICIVLSELDQSVLVSLTSEEISLLQRLTQESAGILWVTRGGLLASASKPEMSMFHGLARSLRAEVEGLPCITMDFDVRQKLSPNSVAELITRVFDTAFLAERHSGHTVDQELYEMNGILHIKRAIDDARVNNFIATRTKSIPPEVEQQLISQPGRPLKFKVQIFGSLGSFVFEDNLQMLEAIPDDHVQIKVHATGLNFRDVLIIMGELSANQLGYECAGVVEQVGARVGNLKVGDRVAALYAGCFATTVRCPAACVQRVPDSMSLPVAAGLPVIYLTAYYGLIHIGRLSAGETVLIHAAAGGTGQAAIQIAQVIGAEIFVTVGSHSKKKHLMQTYGIAEDHIFHSRDLSFVSDLNQATGGRGVDVVLNSLAGEALQATWRCIAPFGRFVEIGKRDIDVNSRLEMAPFANNVTFSSIDLSLLFKQNLALLEDVFGKAMDFIRTGKVREVTPLLIQPWSKAEECLRLMQAGKHMGKIIIEVREDDLVPVLPKIPSEPKFPENATYLLAGGMGGIGRSMSKWLVGHGARNLVFVSRSGKTPETQDFLHTLVEAGAQCVVVKCDISDSLALSTALDAVLKRLPPLRGIIQCAMVLNDQIFANMSHQGYNNAVQPKVQGSWSLHQASLGHPLDFFVLLSSVAGFVGNAGQANYVAGCTYQDALAAHRLSMGLPATSIDIGRVAGVGFLAENSGSVSDQNLTKLGMLEIQEDELLALLELAVMPRDQGIANGHLITGVHATPNPDNQDRELPFWSRDPVFSHLAFARPHLSASYNRQGAVAADLATLLGSATSISEAHHHMLEAFLQRLSKSLMMPVAEIDPDKPTGSFGIDSLVAVELRNWFVRKTKVNIPVFEILQASSLLSLAEVVCRRSPLVDKKFKAEVIRES
uniref:Putative polyketide synthase n=1 Tax=Fusarium miscanthi TaxID=75915 RepID=A0A0U2T8P4_9HYPO|nr:putative polyketide synthase [Fusarium miscanthi]